MKQHKFQTIALSDLYVPKTNVRPKGTDDSEIPGLADNIEAEGLLQPLVVGSKTKSGYPIHAGSRRYRALKLIETKIDDSIDVPCMVLAGKPSAVEISLAENVCREALHPIDEAEAFAKLVTKRRPVADIALIYGRSEAFVRRHLALADLHPDVKKAFRKNELSLATAKALTLANHDYQLDWLKQAPPQEGQYGGRPEGSRLHNVLTNQSIKTDVALFDQTTAAVIDDLFQDTAYFADTSEFWVLQNAEIERLKESLAEKGWAGVHILGPDEYYQRWEWAAKDKADGGEVVIDVEFDGTVTVREGLVRRSEQRGSGGSSATTEPKVRQELSQKAVDHIQNVRLDLVRARLLENPKAGFRALLTMLLLPDLCSTTVSAWPLEDIGETLNEDARDTIALRVSGAKIESAVNPDHVSLITTLIESTSDEECIDIAALLAIQLLESGSPLVEWLGGHLKCQETVMERWTLDDTLLSLFSDKPAMQAMVEESSPDTEVATLKAGRAALAATVGKWVPRYLRWPFVAYTERHDKIAIATEPADRCSRGG